METKNSIKMTKLKPKFKLALAGAGIVSLILSCGFAWGSLFGKEMWSWFFGKEIANEIANHAYLVLFNLCYGALVSIGFFLIACIFFAYALWGEIE